MKLGDTIRDRITGFTGVLVARTEWLFGCVRVTIQPTELKDGKPIETQTFDEQSVEFVSGGAFSSAPTGGPQDDAAALRR